MGLTVQSTQKGALKEARSILSDDNTIALAGNPNVGKSTVFNSLTGLNQHTGNWPGKTVSNAVGYYYHNNTKYTIVDLPGTYSLISSSKEEEIAADFILEHSESIIVAVADATCLERNLNLVLQILEITPNCILCVNLMDEAKKRRISVDLKILSDILGIPVVGICAAKRKGAEPLKEAIHNFRPGRDAFSVKYDAAIENSLNSIIECIKSSCGFHQLPLRFTAVKLLCGDTEIIRSIENAFGIGLLNSTALQTVLNEEHAKLEKIGITKENLTDKTVFSFISSAEKIADKAVKYESGEYDSASRKADKIVTSKIFGIPIMLGVLAVIFYLSVSFANYPSALLSAFFAFIENQIVGLFDIFHSPQWLKGILVDGVYCTLARVTSVMLPPMAIFFPLFTIMEDFGYLPRVAFNLDGVFKKCRAHGKQCLTMCMGLGCNAAGVTGTRIIDAPRERIIAAVTNSLVPCNGRFPTLIAISSIFFGSAFSLIGGGIISAIAVLTTVLLGIFSTFAASFFLSKTILKGEPSHFILELPPYRKPKIGEVIYRSVFDRTLFVLGRAVTVAAPAGAIIWLTANIHIGDMSILSHCAAFLNPFARLIGLDGYILIAFILGIPANEIVIPILIMGYTAVGNMTDLSNLSSLASLFADNGWNALTAINMMLFTVFHFPCATTLLTIKKETGSVKWTVVSFLLPTVIGITLCFISTAIFRIFA